MIELLPEGKSIGWMQAPPQWIFTHTLRFVGIVRVVIQDGEGFILIKKGTPLLYYFKHGRIELRGNAALDYFNSHPTIEFNLCKYSPDEFAQALKICKLDEGGSDPTGGSEVPDTGVTRSPAPLSPAPGPAPGEESRDEAPSPIDEPTPVSPPPEKPAVPQPAVLDEPDIKIIRQIKKLNGIVAISVFSDDRNILLMGDVEIEPLLKIARSMMATATRISPLLGWGSFVHMTLQIHEGNVIIAPYHNNHLCLLTTRTINIGHIRRILRDLQQTEGSTGA
jgi:predicted regulator of Ras-like GTPase activity (Roadblock/LC7/MglB family)